MTGKMQRLRVGARSVRRGAVKVAGKAALAGAFAGALWVGTHTPRRIVRVAMDPIYPERVVENARALAERSNATPREKRQAAKFLTGNKDFSYFYDILETDASRNKLVNVLKSATERRYPLPEGRKGSTPSENLRVELFTEKDRLPYLSNFFDPGHHGYKFADLFTPHELEQLADVTNDIPGECAHYVTKTMSEYYAKVQKVREKTEWMAPNFKQSYILACIGMIIASILKARRKRKAVE